MRGLVSAALLIMGCTHDRPLSEIHTLAGKPVTVDLGGSAGSVDATAEPTSDGVVFRAASGQVLSPLTITQVSDVHRGRGAAEGLGIGFAVGFPVGAVTGYISGVECDRDPKCWNIPGTAAGTVIIGALFGLLGAAGGAIIGVAVGSHDVYSYRATPRLTPVGPPGALGGVTLTW